MDCLDKVKVTNSGYLRVCHECKDCKETLADLPTENVEKDTIYFVRETEKNYQWTGTEWIEAGGEFELGGSGGTGGGSEITIGENGNWYIDGEDTGKPSRGEVGPQGEVGETGLQGEPGEKGDPGEPGADGYTPVKGVDYFDGEKGDPGADGAKGDKGEPGENGVSISSVKQTTTSTADGGTNVVTVELSDGTKSTFSVKNGSKGSNGDTGEKGDNTTNIGYGTCQTSASTVAKVITVNDEWKLAVGSIIIVKFTYTNTASNPTFNVNGTGAKRVWYNTALISTSNLSYAGTANRPMKFFYDGAQYVFIGWSYDANTNTDVNVKQTQSTTSNYRAVLMGTSHNANPSNLNAEETGQVYKNTRIVACPSTGELKATTFTGELNGEVVYDFAEVPTGYDTETGQIECAETMTGVTNALQQLIGFTTYITNLFTNKTAKIPSYVGMIIHSTTLADEDSVKKIYGGTSWTKIEGRFLLGQSNAYPINSTGGEAEHTLTESEMPSHTHIFTGTEVTSGNQSANHTHGIPQLSGSATGGSHTHTATIETVEGVVAKGSAFSRIASNGTGVAGVVNIAYDGGHTHSVTTNASTTQGNNVNHSHKVTAKGTNDNTGGGIAHNNMPPYKTVYIWERTE